MAENALDPLQIYEHNRVQVSPGQRDLRVDAFLANNMSKLSRSQIKQAGQDGLIKVNEQVVKPSYKVKPYDEVSVVVPYPEELSLAPEAIPLDIVHEDEDLLVINKPAGMVVHPGNGNSSGTLINALLHHLGEQGEQLRENSPYPLRPGLVHRIDKDTTGLLVVAKHEYAYNYLARQFYERSTDRRYYALVWGNILEDEGTIVGHIGRSVSNRKRFRVYENGNMGKHAVTRYEVLQRFGVATLVRCKLETGRTHQIRVHFKYRGNTLFNDRFYGGGRILRGKTSRAFKQFINDCFTLMPRQALHAKTLGFRHPRSEAVVHFNSEIPADFREVLRRFVEFFRVTPLPELQELLAQHPKQFLAHEQSPEEQESER
jgi:23S rRNA pseudouridine1911/1915/1917 synthase